MKARALIDFPAEFVLSAFPDNDFKTEEARVSILVVILLLLPTFCIFVVY